MLKRLFYLGLLFSATSALAYSPNDPVAYQINQSIPSTVTTHGGTYVENITFKSQLPFTMVKPLVIAKNGSPSGEFTYSDGCSGLKLTPGQTCTVQADLTPVTNGTKTLQFVIEGYSNAQVPVPQPAITTTASGNSGSTGVTGVFTSWSGSTNMTVGQTNNFTFTFTNNGSTAPTNVVTSCTNATTCSSNCATALTTQGSTCTVTGTFTATSAMSGTTQSVDAVLSYYGQGTPLTVPSSALTIATAGLIGTVVPGSASIITGQAYTVTYTFTNNTGQLMTGVTATPPSASGWTTSSNGCNTAGQLTASGSGSSCTVVGTFTASTIGSTTLTASAAGTIGSTPYSSGNVNAVLTATGTSTGARVITVNNACPFPVWVSLASGAYSTAAFPKGLTCSATNLDCPSGTTCDTAAGLCYWDVYAPAGGNEIAASGSTTITIPSTTASLQATQGYTNAGDVVFWHGGLAGMTGCSGDSCVTANCGNGASGCTPGGGFQAPVTQSEFTLQQYTADTYDVEVINGFNIPLSMAPANPSSYNSNYKQGYYCGTPADSVAQNPGTDTSFSACNFANAATYFPTTGANGAALDPSTFYWVTSGGPACTTQSQCTGQTICGIAQVPVNPGVAPPKLAKSCGKFLGYMTADQACAYDVPNGDVNAQALGFNCTTNASEGGQVSTIYACTNTFAASSYTPSNPPCCGCVNWNTYLPAGSQPTAPGTVPECNTSPTNNIDPNWTTYATPYIQWMKRVCSSVYTYPFDDETSTFNCASTATPSTSDVNQENYTVTLCGGNSGIATPYATPTSGGISVYDGRNG